ncbi:double-strand break repair protein AddB [Kordiimonas pumila]|uniref:Double-strand break repair protein AddB n=1 Tax=Kordiimonas pumila TaxID=2161677 RepID=A0ABV7CZQ8_9PROT|nr:double-strand break repair protein AddB [Kordiimonas pumila]
MVGPRIYTIDPNHSFVDSLAAGLLEMAKGDALALAGMTVLLPNRRAQRSLQEAFLRILEHKTTLLPVMRPIGDVEDDDISFLGVGLGLDPSTFLPPIAAERRQALLMQLVMKWQGAGGGHETPSPAQSWRLAADLAKLMDQVDTEGLPYEKLADLVPENLAQHWEITLEFLKIVTETWPAVLAAEGASNPVQYRDQMLAVLADAWQNTPPKGPIIAAGSTGSIPATARLLSVVARLPEGMVVLPGFDCGMTDDIWDAIDPAHPLKSSHPQTAMKNLLLEMGASRHEVAPWPVGGNTGSRTMFFRDALLPAALTPAWRTMPYVDIPDSELFAGVRSIVTPTRREEADAIAVLMREVLETPGKTAALVTPDRQLARHVRASLGRWQIEIDDSGGDRVLNTVPGRLFALIADAAVADFAPVALLALLQHPLVSFGSTRAEFLEMLRRLDKYVLRGVRPAGGLGGLLDRAAEVAADSNAPFTGADLAILTELEKVFAPFAGSLSLETSLAELLNQHILVAEELAKTIEASGEHVLWQGEAGQALADAISALVAETGSVPAASAEGYAPLFAEMLAGVMVRPVWRRHPRLSIWGPLEARLQRADVMILGGLNEGVWPTEMQPDPWMNQSMRQAFGLPPLTRRIGQSAHDFVQAASGGTVYLTRAEKVDGSPTVPSRWWYRIEALSGRSVPLAARYHRWAEQLAHVPHTVPSAPPAPKPPLDARPKRLSVTQVENWMRDPYGLYAKKILNLYELDPVDDRPNAAKKGVLLHEALECFLKEPGPRFQQEGLQRLIAIGHRVFEPVLNQPAVYAFWWPRFMQIAEWFVAHEEERMQAYAVAAIEVYGERSVPGTDFTVFAIADRIDVDTRADTLAVIDYKTGGVPSAKTIAAGYAPQLPLEAWIAESGGFKGVPAKAVSDLVFWKLSGGTPVQEQKRPIKDIDHSVQAAAEGLARLIDAFSRETTPYLSNPLPSEAGYGTYDHLARVKEWRGGKDPFEGGES